MNYSHVTTTSLQNIASEFFFFSTKWRNNTNLKKHKSLIYHLIATFFGCNTFFLNKDSFQYNLPAPPHLQEAPWSPLKEGMTKLKPVSERVLLGTSRNYICLRGVTDRWLSRVWVVVSNIFYFQFYLGKRIWIFENMDVSENSGTPKSSILIGFSIINHPFWGTPIFGNTHICLRGVTDQWLSRWWFQIFFIFSPKIGEISNFDEYFSKGLKPPTSCVWFP